MAENGHIQRYDPAAVEARWHEIWDREGVFDVPNPAPGRHRRALLRARDAPVPVGRAAHGARQELHDGRRRDAVPAPERPSRDAPDGLRRLRPARRERRDQVGPPPGGVDAREHRGDPPADAAHGLVDRLEPRALDVRAGLLPLDAVDLPAPPRGGPGVSQERRRQVVPQGPDGARERAGDRRALRAVRHRGRGRARSTSGSSRSPTTPIGCSTTWSTCSGPSGS